MMLLLSMSLTSSSASLGAFAFLVNPFSIAWPTGSPWIQKKPSGGSAESSLVAYHLHRCHFPGPMGLKGRGCSCEMGGLFK